MSTWRDALATLPELPHEEMLESRMAHDGFLKVRVDDVRLPSGKHGTREVLQHGGAVFMIPVTNDGHVIMIRQYRYATGEYLIELPAGILDRDESLEDAARRELREEIQHEPASVRQLAEVYLTPGYSTERGRIFLCEGCTPIDFDTDPDEPISILRVPLREIPDMLDAPDCPIRNAMTMNGLLWLVHLGMCN